MGLGLSLVSTLPMLSGEGFSGIEQILLGPAALGSVGIVGASILERILDNDDTDGAETDGTDGDALMDDAGGGAFGDMDGGFDDFDDMDGFDDGMGGLDGGDDGGAALDELEHKVDELENEVGSLSSTVNTVRSENEEISGRVEDVEEDIRNLLDIYEMVTRGINPFVDDAAGDFDLGGEGSLGLFDSGDDEEAADAEEVDESIMSADAEGFFDEELAEDNADEFGDDLESEEMSDQTDSGGKTFSELKEEYDSGEAEWADDDESFDDMLDEDTDDDELGDFAEEGFEDDTFGDDFGDPIENGSSAGSPAIETESEPDPEPEPDPDPEPEPELDPETASATAEHTADGFEPEDARGKASAAGSFQFVSSDQLSSGGEKPYLTALPGDYVGDLVVMEWLEFLVGESTVTDAARAVNYYERIEWIGPDVADQLRSFLSGFGDIDRNKVDRPGTEHLARNHHIKSLKYIMQLNGTTATSVILDRWDSLSGQDGNNGGF